MKFTKDEHQKRIRAILEKNNSPQGTLDPKALLASIVQKAKEAKIKGGQA